MSSFHTFSVSEIWPCGRGSSFYHCGCSHILSSVTVGTLFVAATTSSCNCIFCSHKIFITLDLASLTPSPPTKKKIPSTAPLNPPTSFPPALLVSTSYEYTSMNSLNESKNGFWGVLARKAKTFLEDDTVAQKLETYEKEHPKLVDKKSVRQTNQSQQPPQIYSTMEIPPQKSSDSISSSLNYIGGTIKNVLEEGLTIMESKTADIIQETRKLQIRRKGASQTGQNQAINKTSPNSFPQIQADYETQLKASRDVANAMAAKAKLLMREMKTVKADLAFAKERCTQLEEENKVLREGLEKGSNPEDDDLIRLQLETLLAEKGRLAHENSVYARENRFLREIVEYHQLTMQDVVYMDEGAEEVTEVCPIPPRSTLSTAALRSLPPEVASIVVPEACPIVPVPPSPSPSPRAWNGISSPSARASSAPSSAED